MLSTWLTFADVELNHLDEVTSVRSLHCKTVLPSFLILFFSFCLFLGLHLWHMGVLRLGVESDLQLLAYITATATWDPSSNCNLHHSSRQRWIPDPLSKARDWTRILMDTSQMRCTTMGTPNTLLLWFLCQAMVPVPTQLLNQKLHMTYVSSLALTHIIFYQKLLVQLPKYQTSSFFFFFFLFFLFFFCLFFFFFLFPG